MGLIAFLVIGLVAGLIARALLPGNQGMGMLATLALGLVGSFVGGFLGSLMRSDGNWMALQPSGLLWSTLGALVVLGISGFTRSRSRA
jgi:uncharacterized membrane protein YeaQ/YmgE (transglycosylase-associated protein family)